MSSNAFGALFTPGRIGNLEIPNRVVKSPQSTATSNPDGTVTERTVNHYRRLGEGGIGLVMTEYSYIDDDASKAIHNQMGNSRREHVSGLGWLVDEVHATGAKVGIQIAHGGRQKFLGTAPIKSASNSSWVDVEGQYGVVPTPMTVAEIDAVVNAFAEAAARAHAARFDLVEVHAGHGYLITNFLSPHTNTRDDEYGGSFENRARLLLRVVDAIRAAVPREFPLSIRLSVVDYEPDGITIEETVQLCRELEAHGVDVIHASGGHHATMEWEVSPWYRPRQPHRWGWEQIREAVTIPVIASGSLVSPDIAHEIIASGSADFVSLGRAMLADPDWARKTRDGRVLEITPCIRCNDGCLHRGLNKGRSSGCSVNPSVNEEGRHRLVPAVTLKRVVVVGGGPAGLRSAALLSDRGHDVCVLEPGELGGALAHSKGSAVKQDLDGLRKHLIHELERREIAIHRTTGSISTIVDLDPGAVVIATGAPARVPDFPVAEDAQVVYAHEVRADSPIAGRVVVIGGGLHGCEVAMRLTEMGAAAVTLVEQAEDLLGGDEVAGDVERLPHSLRAASVEIRTRTTAQAITSQGVEVISGDRRQLLPADTVVLALGRVQRDRTLTTGLRDKGFEVHVVGSADRPGRVFDAIHSAFFTARLI